MAEPEVKIKIDFDTKTAQQKTALLKQSIDEVVKEAKKKEKELAAFGEQAINMSASVEKMLQQAKASGKANVEETLSTEFASTGLAEALQLGDKVEKYFKAFSGLPGLLSKINADAQKGTISVEEAYKRVERYKMLLSQLEPADLASDTNILQYDLKNAEGLQDVLNLWEKLSKQADDNTQSAKKIEAAARQQSKALLDEKNALDVNAEGYEKRAAELLRSSMAYEEVGDRAAAQAAKFDSFKKKLTDALSNVDSNEGTQKALDLLSEYQTSLDQQASKTEKINKQLEATDNERVERLRKAEEAANRAEEQARKRSEAEAARVQKAEQNAEKESFAMQLVSMSREQLIATIRKLSEAQKKASEEGDREGFKKYTLQIQAARTQMERLRNATQLSRIAFLQQAQVAGQMGLQVEKVTEGISNFDESLEEGKVDLKGMAEGMYSLGMSIQAGLGPMGWFMLALDGLSRAINWYVEEQKEAEEIEKQRQARLVHFNTIYTDAAAAAKAFKDEEARKAEIDELLERYDTLNQRLRDRNTLQDENLRMKQAELLLSAKDDEMQLSFERNEIMRAYWRGEIDEEERDKRLDNLKVKQAENKKKQTQEQGALALSDLEEKERIAEEQAAATAEELAKIQEKDKDFRIDPAEMEKRAAAYLTLQNNAQDEQRRAEEADRALESLRLRVSLAKTDFARETYQKELDEKEADVERMRLLAQDLFAAAEQQKNSLGGWAYEEVLDGEYAEKFKHQKELLKRAEDEAKKASEERIKLSRTKAQLVQKNAIDEAKADKDYQNAIRHVEEEEKNRQAKKTFEAKTKEREQKKRLEKEQAEEITRRQAMQAAALEEGEYEGGMTKQGRRLAKGGAYAMLNDNRLSEGEIRTLISAMEANSENEALRALLRDIINIALKNKAVTARELGKFKNELEKTRLNTID